MASSGNQKNLSRYNFRTPVVDEDYVLEKTWALRTKHIEVPVANKVIMKRPPFFRPDRLDKDQSLRATMTHFPGLPMRSHYNSLPDALKGTRFALHIYDLKGCLRQREFVPFDLLLAGMYHYAQYVRDMAWICDEEVSCKDGVVQWPRVLYMVHGLSNKRCWFFIINDQDLDQYSLAWYDVKHQTIWYVDSRPNSAPTSQATMAAVGMNITKLAQKVIHGCQPQPIQRVGVTARPASTNYSALFMLENFRMRILESPEQNKAIRCESGLMDWTRAIHRISQHGVHSANPLDDLLDQHLYAFAMELSSLPDRLRWPPIPATKWDNWKDYLRNTVPYTHKPNCDFLPDKGASYPMLSVEPQEFQRNQSQSLLDPSAYRASRASTMGRSITPVMSSREGSRSSSIPRLADQFSLASIAKSRQQSYAGTGKMPAVREESMSDINQGSNDFYSAPSSPMRGVTQPPPETRLGIEIPDFLSAGGSSRQASLRPFTTSSAGPMTGVADPFQAIPSVEDDPFASVPPSRQPSREPSVRLPPHLNLGPPPQTIQPSRPLSRARQLSIGSTTHSRPPFARPSPVLPAAAASNQPASAQPSPVLPPSSTPDIPSAQPMPVPSGAPQRASRPMSARHQVNYEWGLRNRDAHRARMAPVPSRLQSPYTSLWSGDSPAGDFRPTHTAAWRGFAFAKDQETRDRDISAVREQNRLAQQRRTEQ